jgi:hypothetical protein
MSRRRFVKCALFTLVLASNSEVFAQQGEHPVLDAPGFREHRDYFSEMPFENIDTLTGSLVLRFTDLALPANAGRELRFERTYNSKNRAWNFGIAGIPLFISNPPEPVEHSHPQDGAPALILADGSTQKMAWYSFPNQAIASDFSLFDRTGTLRRLFFPNGDYCDYVTDPWDSYQVRVSSCHDVYSNETEFAYSLTATNPAIPILTITQHLGSSQTRTITVAFPVGGGNPYRQYPTSLTYDGREWLFSPQDVYPPGAGDPEERAHWHFDYEDDSPTKHLLSVTTPHGGVISYEYEEKAYEGPDPQMQYSTEVVKTRLTSGRDISTTGIWEYDYDISLTDAAHHLDIRRRWTGYPSHPRAEIRVQRWRSLPSTQSGLGESDKLVESLF